MSKCKCAVAKQNPVDHVNPVRISPPISYAHAGHRGFTLVELMLVLVVIGIMVATATPYMARSIRGNRLRFAARSVVSAGRYARSMAVMSQGDMTLRFDIAGSSIEVVPGGSSPRGPQPASPETAPLETATSSDSVPEGEQTNSAAFDAPPVSRLKRSLDEVTIASVEVDGGTAIKEGACEISYSRAGTCPPYVVKLLDSRGDGMTVEVDALAGAKVEKGP